MKRVAIFDFCETLVDLQTADEFVIYIHKNNRLPLLNQWLFTSWKWFKKLRFIAIYDRIFRHNPIEKKWLLFSLMGLSESIIFREAEMYSDWLKSRVNQNIWNEFEKSMMNSDLVIICSGGYDSYLNPFFKGFNVQIIGTRLKYKQGKFSGTIEGLDCLGEEKVNRLEMNFGRELWSSFVIDFYSDSIMDMPLFKKSNRKIVAYNSKPPKWAMDRDFETLKWEN